MQSRTGARARTGARGADRGTAPTAAGRGGTRERGAAPDDGALLAAPGRAARGTRHAGAGRFDLLGFPVFYLAHIVSRFDGNAAFDLGRHGFSQSDWRIVATLQYADDLTLTELARITTLERSFVGRMVGDLEGRNLVRRSFPENDRRTTRVSLTAAGEAAFRDLMLPAVEGHVTTILDGIAPADRDALFRVIRHMMRNVYHVAREAAPLLDDERGEDPAR